MLHHSYKSYAPILLRYGLSIVYIWFGLNQIFNPDMFVAYIPAWAYSLPFETTKILLINGIAETILGALLALGLFTRLVALILGLHLVFITVGLGYNDVAVRDFGLTLATFAISLYGPDRKCLDKKNG